MTEDPAALKERLRKRMEENRDRVSPFVDSADVDPIQPIRIEHNYTQINHDGVVEEFYNFIVYHFEDTEGRYMWAKFYLDTAYRVTVAGPFAGARNTKERADAPDLRRRVKEYLSTRFREVKLLTP